MNLLDALASNNKQLGRLVLDTSNISVCLHWLEVTLDKASSWGRAEGQTSRWYIDVLSACPNLQVVHLLASTSNDLYNLFHVLHLLPPSVASLRSPNAPYQRTMTSSSVKHLLFQDDWRRRDPPPADFHCTILDVLSTVPITSPCALSLLFSNWTPMRQLTLPSSPPAFVIERIDIVTNEGQLRNYLPFFPRLPSSLKSIKYSGPGSLDDEDFPVLRNVVGVDLERLSLNFCLEYCDTTTLLDYSDPFRAPSIPVEVFHSFPSLTSLTLAYTHGPSLRLLVTLAQHCPLLSRIEFNYSRWICGSKPASIDPDATFPEPEILAATRNFQHLRSIHLGILPTVDKFRYEGLKSALGVSGIEADYEICDEESEYEESEYSS